MPRKLRGNRDGSSLIYLTDLGWKELAPTLDAPSWQAYKRKVAEAKEQRDLRETAGEGRTRPFLPVIKATGGDARLGRFLRRDIENRPGLLKDSKVRTLQSEKMRLRSLDYPTPGSPFIHPAITPCSHEGIKDRTDMTECTKQASESRELIEEFSSLQEPDGEMANDSGLELLLRDYPREVSQTFRRLLVELPVARKTLETALQALRTIHLPEGQTILEWESHGHDLERAYVSESFRGLFRTLFPEAKEPIFRLAQG